MLRPVTLARTEIHCHLLPGIDDGARDLDESVAMAAAAAADGTGTILATPHVRSDFVTDVSILPELVAELRGILAHAGVGVDVHCSGELGHGLVGRLGQVELETIASGPPGRRWREGMGGTGRGRSLSGRRRAGPPRPRCPQARPTGAGR